VIVLDLINESVQPSYFARWDPWIVLILFQKMKINKSFENESSGIAQEKRES